MPSLPQGGALALVLVLAATALLASPAAAQTSYGNVPFSTGSCPSPNRALEVDVEMPAAPPLTLATEGQPLVPGTNGTPDRFVLRTGEAGRLSGAQDLWNATHRAPLVLTQNFVQSADEFLCFWAAAPGASKWMFLGTSDPFGPSAGSHAVPSGCSSPCDRIRHTLDLGKAGLQNVTMVLLRPGVWSPPFGGQGPPGCDRTDQNVPANAPETDFMPVRNVGETEPVPDRWTNHNVTIRLMPRDNPPSGACGVKGTRWLLDLEGDNPKDYKRCVQDGSRQSLAATPDDLVVKFEREGRNAICYWSWDDTPVGNFERPKERVFLIDRTPPNVTVLLNGTLSKSGWYTTPVLITIDAADNKQRAANVSGLRAVSYMLNGADQARPSFLAYNGPFFVDREGSHDVVGRALDEVLNEKRTPPTTFQIDTTPPLPFNIQLADDPRLATRTLVFYVQEATSGLARVEVVNRTGLSDVVVSKPVAREGGEWEVRAEITVDGRAREFRLDIAVEDGAGHVRHVPPLLGAIDLTPVPPPTQPDPTDAAPRPQEPPIKSPAALVAVVGGLVAAVWWRRR